MRDNDGFPIIDGGQHADQWDSDDLYEPPEKPVWRRWLIPVVAVVTVIALAMIPLYNLLDPAPPVADNGLAVCGFDYCIVQDAIRDAGLDTDMSRLANTFLDDGQAEELAKGLASDAGVALGGFEVVDRLEGQIKGVFDPATGIIYVERPIRAWIVVHEVAHLVASGHGTGFQRALIELTRSLSD